MMTSMQRVLTTLGHTEPDRVPFFLLPTMHGARELGLSIRDYFASSETVARGQLLMRERYRHDCLYGFYYASVEVEAFGGEVIYREDGPPNSGRPLVARGDDILRLAPPCVEEANCLAKVLGAIRQMKEATGGDVPIIGVVMSPFSLPVMQLGFDQYLDVMYERADMFGHLMRVNEEFCVNWANAQLAAGATAICYFDPVSSPTIVPREIYLKTGFEVAQRTIARIKGPTATHFASGATIPVAADLPLTGTAVIGVSCNEDLALVKETFRGKLTVLGNLNGIEMRTWTAEKAEAEVKKAIAKAGRGGGFILADTHGEIPWQVPEEVLSHISTAVHKWGVYPLDWINEP
jgi:uroporphyrinogen decarboxylase